jgi:hypothetical protein
MSIDPGDVFWGDEEDDVNVVANVDPKVGLFFGVLDERVREGILLDRLKGKGDPSDGITAVEDVLGSNSGEAGHRGGHAVGEQRDVAGERAAGRGEDGDVVRLLVDTFDALAEDDLDTEPLELLVLHLGPLEARIQETDVDRGRGVIRVTTAPFGVARQ